MTAKENTPLYFTGASPEEAWPLIRDFHYSGRLPSNIQHIYVFREGGGLFGDFGVEIVAAIVWTMPPTRWSEPVLELSRLVRQPDFSIPLTQLISLSCKALKLKNRDLLVSFADKTQDHHGGIYQAASWHYNGINKPCMDGVIYNETFIPGRTANGRWGTRSPAKLRENKIEVEPHYDKGKHLYWRALNKKGSKKAQRLGLQIKSYPKPDIHMPGNPGRTTPGGVCGGPVMLSKG